MVQATAGEAETRGDIGRLEIWQLGDDLLRRQAGGEEFEDVDDADAHPANAGASSALLRIDGDAIHQLDRIAHTTS
jgi:hypothetical protein